MKSLLFTVLMLNVFASISQVLIHAHNDYAKPEPLFNALRNKAFTIESDVFLVDGKLFVAHDRKDIDTSRTLNALYLDPIDSLFRTNKGSISPDATYHPTLAIDVKADGEKSIAAIIEAVRTMPQSFDRRVNPNAVQVFISGDRGPVEKWKTYPPFIMFDGRPYEQYDKETLEKVLTISDSYIKIYKNKDLNVEALQTLVKKVHDQDKPVRIWGAPDFPAFWNRLKQEGVDIINTDKVTECRKWVDAL